MLHYNCRLIPTGRGTTAKRVFPKLLKKNSNVPTCRLIPTRRDSTAELSRNNVRLEVIPETLAQICFIRR